MTEKPIPLHPAAAREDAIIPEEPKNLTGTYDHLLTLWTSGVRDYHTMLSDYLTANSIFVAVIGLIVSKESQALSFTVLILLLCVLSGQNALWEWQLRGIELAHEWQGQKLITGLYRLHEMRQPIEDLRNVPTIFKPNWAFRQHRQWWAHRAVSFPWFFGSVYGLFLVWGLAQLIR
jgi:hypothetical protein